MLNRIRLIGDSKVLKITLLFIAASMLIPLFQSVTDDGNSPIVKFKYADNIYQQEFLQSYELKKSTLGYSIEDKNEVELLKMKVLDALIMERLTSSLVKIYNLEVSETTVKSFLRQFPVLLGDDGALNLNQLKKIAIDNNISENKLLDNITTSILQNFIVKEFLQSYKAPNQLISILTKSAQEKYHLEVLSIDADSNKLIPAPTIDQNYLKDFYSQNQDKFLVPSKRSFNYVYITIDDLASSLIISDEDALSYINDNITEFPDKNENNNIIQAKKTLSNLKSNELLIKLNTEIDDEIASGLGLDQIATKFSVKLQKVTDVDLTSCKNEIYEEISNIILSSDVNEISSPIEILKGRGLIIFEVTNIIPSYVEDFESVESSVKKLWLDEFYRKSNADFLQNFPLKNLAQHKNIISHDKNLVIHSNSKDFSYKVIQEIMNLKVGDKTRVFSDILENKFYVAWVKSISYDPKLIKDRDHFLKNTQDYFVSIFFEELLSHLRKVNKVQVNTKHIIFNPDFY